MERIENVTEGTEPANDNNQGLQHLRPVPFSLFSTLYSSTGRCVGETDRNLLLGPLKSFLGYIRDHTRFILPQILHPPNLSPSRAPSSAPDSHILLSSHVPSVPPTPPLSSQTLGTSVYPTSSVTVWPWYVKSLFLYKICKEAEIWPSDISVFPRSHRGLAYWPVDKYFPNWWMTAAGISGPTHLLLALVGLVLSCMGTSIVSTSIFLKVWKPFSNTL